jgi:hypothetical protein
MFKEEADNIHPLICESFVSTCEMYSNRLFQESTELARSVHFDHAINELIGSKVGKFVSALDAEIATEKERLLQNLAEVDHYPFAGWAHRLTQSIITKMDRSATKYKLNLSSSPKYQKNLEQLRSFITGRVGLAELAVRHQRQEQKAAEAARTREELLSRVRHAKEKTQEALACERYIVCKRSSKNAR